MPTYPRRSLVDRATAKLSPTENPITRIRLNAGNWPSKLPMSQDAFGSAMGFSGSLIGNIERGTVDIPDALLDALEALGYDRATIESDYRSWREPILNELRERLTAGK